MKVIQTDGRRERWGRSIINLREENESLKRENDRLVELITCLQEEMDANADCWRSAYLSLVKSFQIPEATDGNKARAVHIFGISPIKL